MEAIEHRNVAVNGINMHVAEMGEGPVVLLLHGFPELWYSWRHQIAGLAARGYRAVAPDFRGYGDTDAPASVGSYTIFHIVGDLVALIDALSQDQVFVVGHDWGAMVAWYLCLFRHDRVRTLVNLSVPYRLWDPARKPIEAFRASLGDDFYICRYQETGTVEAEFGLVGDNALLLKKFLTSKNPKPLIMPKKQDYVGSLYAQVTLPAWLSEDDINYYESKFDKSGFTGGLNYYRNLDISWELTVPWMGSQIMVPAKCIIGDLDPTYHFPGIKDYIHGGGFKDDVPFLEDVVIMGGVGHFINQEKAPEITNLIYDFIQKF